MVPFLQPIQFSIFDDLLLSPAVETFWTDIARLQSIREPIVEEEEDDEGDEELLEAAMSEAQSILKAAFGEPAEFAAESVHALQIHYTVDEPATSESEGAASPGGSDDDEREMVLEPATETAPSAASTPGSSAGTAAAASTASAASASHSRKRPSSDMTDDPAQSNSAKRARCGCCSHRVVRA